MESQWGRSHESASVVLYQNSIVSFAIARSFSLELDRLSRGDLMASRCIKRFIFTRMAGSRASWHNASGNSRADSGSHPDILIGLNHRCTDRYSTPTVVGVEIEIRMYCTSSINVHIAIIPSLLPSGWPDLPPSYTIQTP